MVFRLAGRNAVAEQAGGICKSTLLQPDAVSSRAASASE